jgi:predicted nucleic acid-binding protein
MRTYIDSGVLISAARGTAPVSELALPFLYDAAREYVTSDCVRLELVPKAKYHRRHEEVEFYEAFFSNAVRFIPTSEALVQLAYEEACRCGLRALDAIHIASAVFAGAEELITSERATKPMHRTRLVRVISIFGAE